MLILRLYSQDKMNWLMAGFVVIWMIVLLAMYEKMHSGDEKKKNIWKMLCQVPLGLCVLHFIFGRFIGNAMLTGFSYGGFYLVAVWTACFPWLFRKKRKKSKVILSAVLAVSGCFLTIAYPAIDNCGMRNYTHKNFEASFEAMVENMKQYDTLIDWKQIDVDQIAQQVKPLIQEAQQKDDPALFYTALCQYTYHFYDGHTWVKMRDQDAMKRAEEMLAGNDYGFSLIRLTSGEVIATLVEAGSEAVECGIKNGTVITKWDEKPIDDAVSEVQCIYTKEYDRWPVKENEEMFQPIFLAGRGEETLDVTFLTENGEEKSVTLRASGSYRERLERACEILLAKDKLEQRENFEADMLSDSVGYIRVKEEEYSFFSDLCGYLKGSNEAVREMFDQKVEDLLGKGMKKLIIDTRNNTGGYADISLEIASLFTDEKIYINSYAKITGEDVQILRDAYVEGCGKYKDLPVIVLTNERCVSSGDYLVYCLKKTGNAKIVGITTTAGSSQPVGGDCVMTDGICHVKYPQNWMLDENGDRFIDADATRQARIVLDEKIPLTKEAVDQMFEQNQDYELNYIIGNCS